LRPAWNRICYRFWLQCLFKEEVFEARLSHLKPNKNWQRRRAGWITLKSGKKSKRQIRCRSLTQK
jgi:hypothetical protein